MAQCVGLGLQIASALPRGHHTKLVWREDFGALGEIIKGIKRLYEECEGETPEKVVQSLFKGARSGADGVGGATLSRWSMPELRRIKQKGNYYTFNRVQASTRSRSKSR